MKIVFHAVKHGRTRSSFYVCDTPNGVAVSGKKTEESAMTLTPP
jgi:hypothetical protein